MKYICPYCNKELSCGRGLGGHKTKCLSNPNRTTNKGKKIKQPKRIDVIGYCKFCNKQSKNSNSLTQHEIRCKDNPNRISVNNLKGRCNIPIEKRGWSKNLTKETDHRLQHISEGLKKHYKNHEGTFKGKHHTKRIREFLSKNAIENHFQLHWGTRTVYEYQGFKFQSSYEVEVLKSLDENGIKWEKPRYGIFKYTDNNGKLHTYTPDIYLPDYDVYLDPKNDFLINNNNPSLGYSDCEKITWVCTQNNVKILILNKDQLKWDCIKDIINA